MRAQSGQQPLVLAASYSGWQGGVFSEFQEETEHFTATVSAYAESDCTIDAYGKCPQNSFGSGGLPPCTACAEGLVASDGSTFCTVKALRDLDLTETIAIAIVAGAVGGFAGPGNAELEDGNEFYKPFIDGGAESGTISVAGNFATYDGTALPDCTALYLYLCNEDVDTDYMRGQGVIDASTGDYTATIDGFPIGYSAALLSFVVLDAGGGADITSDNYVFVMDTINEGGSSAVRTLLEWDSNDGLELWVTDPNGDRVPYYNKSTDIGYVNHRNGGGWTAGGPDTGFTYSFEGYVVFSGLSGDAMLGEYRVFAKRGYAADAGGWMGLFIGSHF